MAFKAQSESKVITPEVYPAIAGLILCTSPAGVIGFKELGLCTDSSLSATRVTCRCVFCSIFDYLKESTVMFCGKPAVAGYTLGVMTFDSDCEVIVPIPLQLMKSTSTDLIQEIALEALILILKLTISPWTQVLSLTDDQAARKRENCAFSHAGAAQILKVS